MTHASIERLERLVAVAWVPAALVCAPALGVFDFVGIEFKPGDAGPGVGAPQFGVGMFACMLMATIAWALGGGIPLRRASGRPEPVASPPWLRHLILATSLPPLLFAICTLAGPYAHLGYWLLWVCTGAVPAVVVGRSVGRETAPTRTAPAWAPYFVLVMTIVGLVVVDRAATTVLPSPQPGLPSENAADGSYWRFAPGARIERDGVEYHFTEWGFRGASQASDIGDGGARVLTLGDSIPFGGGYPIEQTFPVISGKLAGEQLGRPVTVANAGIPSFSTAQIRALYLGELSKMEHELVVVVFHIDDVNRELRYKVGDRLFARAWPEWLQWLHYASPLWRVLHRAVGIRDATFLHHRSRSYAQALPDALDDIDAIASAATERGARVAVLNVPYFSWEERLSEPGEYEFARADAVLAQWCASRGVRLIETLPLMAAVDINQLRVAPGDVHLNQNGHQLVAKAMAGLLASLLEAR